MATITHLLNRTLAVWRPAAVADGAGGQTVTYAETGDLACQVSQPSAAERQAGGQWGARHTHTVHADAGADVRRGDELRGDGQVLRVLATLTNSRATYTRCECELVQPEPGSGS